MRDQHEFAQLLDRYRFGQSRRLSIGLQVDRQFESVEGALVVVEGRGKFLRPAWIEQRRFEIPQSVARACRVMRSGESPSATDFIQLRSDLTGYLADSTTRLVSLSGKAADKLMVACVLDPGLWLTDFDGQQSYEPFCDACQLAESTGMTVVDALPQRDLASGGRGLPILPLANWLLMADRNHRIAEYNRILLSLKEDFQLTVLPASDGLDDDLPEIRFALLPGLRMENHLLEMFAQRDMTATELSHVGAQGTLIAPLAQRWCDIIGDIDPAKHENMYDPLAQAAAEFIDRQSHCLADVIQTLYRFLAEQARRFVKDIRLRVDQWELVFATNLQSRGLLMNELRGQFPQIETRDFKQIGMNLDLVDSAATAILGLMHMDQMPASIPWLTGCEVPRVLGRLTPGRPSNWRQVIVEMADYRPPVMKLRDAV